MRDPQNQKVDPSWVPHPMQKASSQLQLVDQGTLRHMRISELRRMQHAKSADCLFGVPELSELLFEGNLETILAPQKHAAQQPPQPLPANNCCSGHGDIASRRDDFQEMMKNHVIQLRRDGYEPIPIAPNLLAITKYWDPFLKAERMAKKKQRDRVFRFTAQRVCKLHQFNRCNYGLECRNIHICRVYWRNELSAILEASPPGGPLASKGAVDPSGALASNALMILGDDDDDEEDDTEIGDPMLQQNFSPQMTEFLKLRPQSSRSVLRLGALGRQHSAGIPQPGATGTALPEVQRAMQCLSISSVQVQQPQVILGPSQAQHQAPPVSMVLLSQQPGSIRLENPIEQRSQSAGVFLQAPSSHVIARTPGQPRHIQYLMMPQTGIVPPQPIQNTNQAPPSLKPTVKVGAAQQPPLQRSQSQSLSRVFQSLPRKDQNSSTPDFPHFPPSNMQPLQVPSGSIAVGHAMRVVRRADAEDRPSSQMGLGAPTNGAPMVGANSPAEAADWPWQMAALGAGHSGKETEAPKEKISDDEYKKMLTCIPDWSKARPGQMGRQGSSESMGSGSDEERLLERLPLDLASVL